MPQFSDRFSTRITLQRRVVSVDSHGAPVTAWQTYAVTWAAMRRPGYAVSQAVMAGQLENEGNVTFTTHYIPDVAPGDRVATYDGRHYDVLDTADPDGFRMTIVIYARDQQNAG